MAKGRKTDERSELAGRRFEIAVQACTASFEGIVNTMRWVRLVEYDDIKQIRRWAREGVPLKRVDQVAAFFGLEAQAFIDDRVDQRDFYDTIYRLKPKVMKDGSKNIGLERIAHSPVLAWPDLATPDEFSGSFAAFMKDRSRNFSGREFLFDALDDYLAQDVEGNGYFLITGDPGIGKSAVMAQLVSTRGYLHHFNIGPQSINRPRHFLKNICTQLIDRYALPYADLPEDATRDGRVFNRLLAESAVKLPDGEKIVIAVDALDEVDNTDAGPDANLLHLPEALPERVYVVATSRRLKEMPLRVMNLRIFDLQADSQNNREDAAHYVEGSLKDPMMQERIAGWGVDEPSFIEAMVEKSEGNFMYLRHVLPAVRDGDFKVGRLVEVPRGLLNYYRHHWKQMRGRDAGLFDILYQPVVCILAAVKKAVSLDQIHNFTGLAPLDICKAIYTWYPFLHTEYSKKERSEFYRVYHTLFQEFLYNEIEPGLKHSHGKIADFYMQQIDLGPDDIFDPVQ